MLQKIVPNIIHTNREEKPTWIGPISNFKLDNATVITTKAMVTLSLLVLELNSFSNWVKIQPIREPSIREQIISTSGFTIMETKST